MAARVIGRDALVEALAATVREGRPGWLVGPRSSGRSAVLTALADRLEDDGWGVVRAHGSQPLQPHPLPSVLMSMDADLPWDARRGLVLGAAAETLRQELRGGRRVLVIDDGDLLDGTSWGLIDDALRRLGTPVVVTALDRSPGSTAPAFTGTWQRFELSALRFEELEVVLRDALGSGVDLDTTSRIYSKSGGNVGLALAIAHCARNENRLVKRGSVWLAPGSLWGPGLRGMVDTLRAGLTPDEIAALETVSLVGLAELTIVRRLASLDALVSLEDRGLLRVTRRAGRQLVTVTPAILAEAVQHDTGPLRRTQLSEAAGAILEERVLATLPLATVPAGPGEPAEPDAGAVSARLFQEHARVRALDAGLAWTADPGPSAAVGYLDALLQVPGAHDRIDEVLASTDAADAAPRDRVAFAVRRSEWLAFTHNDLDGALEVLRAARGDDDGYDRLLDASAARLELLLRHVPEDFEQLLEADDGLPTEVADDLFETQALILLSLGRLSATRRALASVSPGRGQVLHAPARWLPGWLLLVEGQFEAARAHAVQGLEEATAGLDADGVFHHGYLLALLFTFEGDYASAEQVLSRVLSIGDPSPALVHARLGLWVVGTLVAVRRGNTGIAERFLRAFPLLPIRRGPLIGQCATVAIAQMDAYNGDDAAAGRAVWDEGELQWDLGYRLSATQLLLMSAEMSADPAQMRTLRERVPGVEGKFQQTFLSFLDARDREDAEALRSVAPAIARTGRPGLALNALELAERLFTQQGHDEQARGADADRRRLLESLDGRQVDTKRFLTSAITLTERESEIASLVARGYGNKDIATRLVVSVRTVESHLNRILRKTGSATRDDLVDFVSRQ